MNIRKPNNRLFTFANYQLDEEEYLLLRDGKSVPLQPKVFATLLALVERHGHIVGKEELMQIIWPDTFVEEINLAKNISILRKTLGSNDPADPGQEFIETVPKRGYRFVCPVQEAFKESSDTTAKKLTPEQANVIISDLKEDKPSVQPVLPEIIQESPSKKSFKWIFAVLIFVLGISGSCWLYGQNKHDVPSTTSAPMEINRITTSSNAFETAISPDGKFVAYVVGEFGKQSLWLKEAASSQVTQLIPFEEKRYRGLAFSPDGNSLYFSQRENSESELILYRLQLRGGAVKRILAGVDSAVSFSPNGSQLVFVREDKAQGKSWLVIANADGSGERKLGVRKLPEFYSVDGPSWSPDGKTIAVAVSTSANDFHYRIMLIQVDGGKERPLGAQMWAWAMRVFWLADGKGLVMLARDKTSGRNSQIWELSYPAGIAHKIINDLNDYRCLSVSADSKKLVTIQSEVRSDIWVVPLANADQAIQITNNPNGQNGYDGLDWSPNGDIVYTSVENGQQNLWITNAEARIREGAENRPKQLTNDLGMNDHYPSISGDGRYIVYASSKSGRVHLWRIDIDGSNPQELTNGNLDLKPNCSPDGQWIVYSTENIGSSAIRKISRIGINGGQAVQLTEKLSEFPVISPDGKLVACIYQDAPKLPRTIALIPWEGGEPVQILKIPFFARPTVRWHPDGNSLSYLTTQDESSNIWLWPLSDKSSTKFTQFNSDRIFAYAWSHDGRYLACARGKANRDVVIVTGFK